MKIKNEILIKNLNVILLIFIIFLIIYINYSSHVFHSDNGNLIRNSRFLLNEGSRNLIIKFHPPIPTYILSIFYLLNSDFNFILFNTISSILIILVACKYFKNNLSITFFLLSIFFSFTFLDLGRYLAPYPLLFLFNFLSFYFLDRHYKIKNKSFLILSSILSGFSLFIYGTALIFFTVPFFYIIFKDKKLNNKFNNLIIYYLILCMITLPWFIWHLKIGGIKYFYYYPLNFYIIKYLPYVNSNFWDYHRVFDFKYLTQFYNIYTTEIISAFYLTFLLISIIVYRKNLEMFFLMMILPVIPTLIAIVSPFSRYIYFTIIPSLIISSQGLYLSIKNSLRNMKIVLIFLFIIFLSLSIITFISHFQESKNLWDIQYDDFKKFKNVINETNCFIFARFYSPQNMFDKNIFFIILDFSEEDAISFLTSSEDEFINISRKYNICYFVTYKNIRRWEIEYYGWVPFYFNKDVTHYKNLESSGRIEKIYSGEVYNFYHLKNATTI